MNSQLLTIKQNIILYDDTLISEVDENLFDPNFWVNHEQTQSINKGRGRVLLIHCQGHPAVLKHYSRGGLISHFLNDKYLWQGEQTTRSISEFRVLQRMHQSGLPVPRPLAARVYKQGIFYTADLITLRIDNTFSMGDLLAEKSLTADLWRTIGKCIALFHRKGFYHHDLNIENILIDSEGSVFLLDFDKTYTAGVSKTIAEKNINRLKRSINKQRSISGHQFPKKEWQILIQEHTKELS